MAPRVATTPATAIDTRGDDGTSGGNNTGDGHNTRDDDGTSGGNNTGDGDNSNSKSRDNTR